MHPAVPEPHPGLVEAIQAGNAVAIVGSGLSCAAGAPSWTSLLCGIVAEAESTQPHETYRLARTMEAMQAGRYLDAASLLKSILHPEVSGAIVRQLRQRRHLVPDWAAVAEAAARRPVASLFKERGAPELLALRPTPSHRMLAQLGFRAVVTTNYDRLLEDAWLPPGPAVYSWSYEHLAQRIQDAGALLVKIHGDVQHPDDIVLAREDYANVVFASRARAALGKLFGTAKLFWIGYGFNDPDLDLLLDECRVQLGIKGGYALALHDDEVMRTRLKGADVTASVLQGHSDVPRYLRRLAELLGRRLVFTVTLAIDWSDEANGAQLGQDVARALAPYAGEVSLWRAEPGFVRLHLEAPAAGLSALRALVTSGDPAFAEVLRRHAVASLDDLAVGSPADAASAPVARRAPAPAPVVAEPAVAAFVPPAVLLDVTPPSFRRNTMPRFPLTIELRVRGADLERRYHYPVYGERFPSAQRFDTVGAAFRAGTARGLHALRGLFARAERDELDEGLSGPWLDAAGQALFEALFGSEEGQWTAVLQAVFPPGESRGATPLRHPVRVRVQTDDPALAGLPWQVTRFGEHLLADSGWTFEVARERSPAAIVDHRAPGGVLLLAPDTAEDTAVSDHVEELGELFDDLSAGPARVEVARSRDELRARLADLRPSIVYAMGHGAALGKQLHLRVGAAPEDWISMRDLGSVLGEHPPHALLLAGRWAEQADWGSAGLALLDRVPLVLVGALSGDGIPARQFALRWLRAWLAEGEDPVAAAHRRPTDLARFAGWGAPLVFAHYDMWRTHRAMRAPGRPLDRAEEGFDRDAQRALAAKHISDLARSPKQRVEAIVAYATPGNALERLPRQIIDYVEREAGDRIHVKHVQVQFPFERGTALHADVLEHSLKAQLGHGAMDRLDRALRAHAPPARGGAARVLWLDFGVLSAQKSYADEVLAWLAFARDRLAERCPEDLRVVPSLALEAEPSSFAKLKDSLPALRSNRAFRTERFRCTALDPLDRGSLVDILDFLDRHGCDAAILEELAEAIFAQTEGRYEETTALLREGLHGWRALHHRIEAARLRGKF